MAFVNLLVVGVALLAVVVLVALDRRGVDLDGPLPELVGWLQWEWAGWWLGLGLLSVVAGSGVMIVGARRMRRLESYRLALVAGALAMVLPPGNPLGVLVGLWALWVLGRRVTQQSFRENPAATGRSRSGGRSLAWVLAGWILVPALLLAGLRGWMVSTPPGMGRREMVERERADQERRVALAVALAESERRDRDRVSDATGTVRAPAGVEAVPPVVVSTVPMSGATGVAAGTRRRSGCDSANRCGTGVGRGGPGRPGPFRRRWASRGTCPTNGPAWWRSGWSRAGPMPSG